LGQHISTIFKDFLTLEDETDMLSRNVGKVLPLDAALHPRRAQIPSASWRKPEIKILLVVDDDDDNGVIGIA
jgi:hypothetical protein